MACVTKICHDGLRVKERMVICKLASHGSIYGHLSKMLYGCKQVVNTVIKDFSQYGINHSLVPLWAVFLVMYAT